MRSMSAGLAVTLAVLGGCATHDDLYAPMNRAAQPGKGLQQTQLAHIGHVETCDGRFEVCFQRLVLTGMLAPRGQTKLLLFARNGNLAQSYDYPDYENIPLWCDSGRVYLFGLAYVPGIPIDPAAEAGAQTGNIIDFSRGIAHPTLTREKRYGSSGGIEDEVRPTR